MLNWANWLLAPGTYWEYKQEKAVVELRVYTYTHMYAEYINLLLLPIYSMIANQLKSHWKTKGSVPSSSLCDVIDQLECTHFSGGHYTPVKEAFILSLKILSHTGPGVPTRVESRATGLVVYNNSAVSLLSRVPVCLYLYVSPFCILPLFLPIDSHKIAGENVSEKCCIIPLKCIRSILNNVQTILMYVPC